MKRDEEIVGVEKGDREGEIEEEEEGIEEVGDEVEEGEENEDEDEDEDEDGYTFKFKEGVNPFDFIEETTNRVQLYKEFERLEYEALAEKKRKALANDQRAVKKVRIEDVSSASMEELMETMNYGGRRKWRKPKKKGRRKGSKKKLSREITRKLGYATLCYAQGCYEEAIAVLRKIILISPDLPDSYHTLGLVYSALGDDARALGFYMLAAHLMPKDSSLWKLLFTWSIERKDIDQANYCLTKAIAADPEDSQLLFYRASLHLERGDHQKAADSYDQIYQNCLENVEALKTAAKLYQKCGQFERSVCILEDYIKCHSTNVDLSVIDLLASIYMEYKDYSKAIQHIEHGLTVNCSMGELLTNLTVKAGICHVNLGDMEKAKILFNVLDQEVVRECSNLVLQVADSLMKHEQYNLALKYYLMLEENAHDNGFLYLNIGQCYLSLKERVKAIPYFYKALETLEDCIPTRLHLASLLVEETREAEAISLLSPTTPNDSTDLQSGTSKPWWLNERIKLKLSQIYRSKGLVENFVEAISPFIHETLYVENLHQKFKVTKKLSKRVLLERVKVLDGRETGQLFRGFRPVAPKSDLSKASRAKRLLQKMERVKEERIAKAQAAGVDWHCDDSSDDEPMLQVHREPSLPSILKDEEYHSLIVDLCKALASLKRFSEALEIISLTLKSTFNSMSVEKKEELTFLGAQLAFTTTDSKHGFDYVKYIVKHHPYSPLAWNCYYKVTSRMKNRDTRHCKLLNRMQAEVKDSIPPYVIAGHQFTSISHHQDAARKYLEAYRLSPDNPLINLCVGTALINLALGFRLHNKHQCVTQGLAFLYNNLRLCEDSQEALYNIARGYHHVGLVSLAVSYYEKVLATCEKDYPIPKLPGENLEVKDQNPGFCDLRREAAYNLHLIYKKSGAMDLARQVLKDHCTF